MAALGGLRADLKCREIEERDLPGVIDCLKLCFPSRSKAFWERGLNKLSRRVPLENYPRFGVMLEDAGRVVGVVLTVYTRPDGEGPVRCHMSSWCIDPDYRGYANRLVFSVFRDRAVTYLNISPVAKTWRVAEGFGMKRFCEGQQIFVPALSQKTPGVRVFDYAQSDPAVAKLTDYERGMIADHLALGCRAIVCEADGEAFPFVFRSRCILRDMLPVQQLIYCREAADLPRFAGALGRHMARSGALLFMVDAVGPIPGLVGKFFQDRGPKYYRGPNPPRVGDLAYSEMVFFGA